MATDRLGVVSIFVLGPLAAGEFRVLCACETPVCLVGVGTGAGEVCTARGCEGIRFSLVDSCIAARGSSSSSKLLGKLAVEFAASIAVRSFLAGL